jgi:hypothetical protein
MPDMISARVPILPRKELNPNGPKRSIPALHGQATEELRTHTYGAFMDRRRPPHWEFARVSLVLLNSFKRPGDDRYRPRDNNNAQCACKPVFDGIVDAGIVPDDDYLHMAIGSVVIHRVETIEEECIIVIVERLDSIGDEVARLLDLAGGPATAPS